MTYIGIGYSGNKQSFLRDCIEHNRDWLEGEHSPRFFGERFVMLYDSNTARELAAKCLRNDPDGGISVHTMAPASSSHESYPQ